MKPEYYYLAADGKVLGPYTPEQLMACNIEKRTKVWRAGMKDWVDADTVAELALEFNKAQQAFTAPAAPQAAPQQIYEAPVQQPEQQFDGQRTILSQPGYNNPQQPMPPTFVGWCIAAIFLCCNPVCGLIALIYGSRVSTQWYMGDYTGAMRSSSNAKIWLIITIVVSFIIYILPWIFLGTFMHSLLNSFPFNF